MTAWEEVQPSLANLKQTLDAYDVEVTRRAVLAASVLAATQGKLDAALAEIEELKKPTPTPTPPPTSTLDMKVGGCPVAGGTSLAAQETVSTKYGTGVAVRQFFATGAAPRSSKIAILHGSWKPTLAAITETWVTNICANLKAGDVIEVWHEADKKVTDGTLTKADVVARKNKFYDIAKKVRPDLLVANTLTGWLFDPKSGKNPDEWGVVKADILGVDCDGVRPANLPYTDYKAETTRALKFLVDFPSYKYFAVPEFGCPRIPAQDPDGKLRAAYHDTYFTLWTQTKKCLFVTMYEYNSSPNYSLETPAEISGLKAWV